ncbi:hypothetical protein NC796_00850 [Aliifodinibius sp. S!AR15-10]|uniref:hypothetical protein n=1 Tax=Aliifodinibius sp. S!AR15-10 TaxID=2950437 RepID=UPI00285F9FE0|nr:hypothetical protein [Aliifodinibius sp. S!AR15-10]MDR8389663.1 hypothetical protein [Aliifodinibius sp. S!AR15-10]
MERIIKHITERLVDQLPDERGTYKLSDLQQSGFPRFVIKRIQVELRRNLAESIILPETEWADMQSETVREAWDQFVSAIRAQARLPKSYTAPVVETAISDIMDILVQPRKNLPDVIFGASDVLGYYDVIDRMDAIVVYPHFATLIPRYMEKRGLNELSKEKCSQIILQADQKLTARYSPLNWAQMLEPLFILLDEQIDSSLLRLFFEDKKMMRVARRFDIMNETLNRSEFIEVLSSPDLPAEDDEQNELFDQAPQSPQENPYSNSWEGLKKTVEGDETEITQVGSEGEETEDQISGLNVLYSGEEEAETDEHEEVEVEEEETDGALNEFFSDEPVEDDTADTTEFVADEEEIEIETSAKEESVAESEDNAEEAEEQFEEEVEEEADEVEEVPESPLNEESKTPEETGENEPIWKRFVSPDEEEQVEQETLVGGYDEPGEEEPLIDLTQEDQNEEEYERLVKLLHDDREWFIEEIFRGADEAYDEALREIVSKDDWPRASQYIEKEVFRRNMVDMYSEAAVDFTDRLQSYFIEITESN